MLGRWVRIFSIFGTCRNDGCFFLCSRLHSCKIILYQRKDENMKKRTNQRNRTVSTLLNMENKGLLNWFHYPHQPRHTYIYCRGKNIAKRFLADAEAEGFTFGDGVLPTEKEYDDIYVINPDLTISYTGWTGHILFKQGKGNVVKIDYGKYIAGVTDYLM